jgi:hypothetical protein
MDIDQRTLARARLALREAIRRWLYDPNVRLIDYGWPERDGKLVEDELEIRFHVVEKLREGPALEAAIQAGKTQDRYPEEIAGIPIDVLQRPYRLEQWFGGWWGQTANPRARRTAPMQGGISISNAYQYGYGTLGGAVEDRETGDRLILSNWHVLAGEWRARPGWSIYQPGRGDGGSQADAVATLSQHAMSSGLDAAVAKLTGGRQLINDQSGLGPVRGVGRAQLGMEVVKSGRRTDVTRGRVTNALQGPVKMYYNGVLRLIHNVATIAPRLGQQVSAPGDSGSLWLEEETMYVVGLHFAGYDRPETALAIHIQPVLDALNVNLVV